MGEREKQDARPNQVQRLRSLQNLEAKTKEEKMTIMEAGTFAFNAFLGWWNLYMLYEIWQGTKELLAYRSTLRESQKLIRFGEIMIRDIEHVDSFIDYFSQTNLPDE